MHIFSRRERNKTPHWFIFQQFVRHYSNRLVFFCFVSAVNIFVRVWIRVTFACLSYTSLSVDDDHQIFERASFLPTDFGYLDATYFNLRLIKLNTMSVRVKLQFRRSMISIFFERYFCKFIKYRRRAKGGNKSYVRFSHESFDWSPHSCIKIYLCSLQFVQISIFAQEIDSRSSFRPNLVNEKK